MTLRKAIQEFRQLRDKSRRRSRQKIYSNFIQLLESLEGMELSFEETRSLESKLSELLLILNTHSGMRNLRYSIAEFKIFLNKELSLVAKGYYLYTGLIYGSGLGLLIGEILFANIDQALGIILGISIGGVVGELIAAYLEKDAKAAGNLI